MKTPFRIVAAALVFTQLVGLAEVRTFTSTAGTTIRGELISLKGDMVTIKKEDGQSITVKASAFSRVDQAYLQTNGTKGATASAEPAKASKDGPFVNSLGMKFVPVPGTQVLFCSTLVPSTVYQQYDQEANSAKPPDPNAPNFDFEKLRDRSLFPIAEVGWDQAKSFCDWLSKKESLSYRLPTDREWSIAVGIGAQEAKDASPAELDRKIKNMYPWGSQWPPPKGYGNYMDETYLDFCKRNKHTSGEIIKGYTDGEIALSPLLAFPPNRLGIHDLSGNMLQWCEGWYDAGKTQRFLRGSTSGQSQKSDLLSSARRPLAAGKNNEADLGTAIRCVLAINGGSAPASTQANPPKFSPSQLTQASKGQPFTNILGMKFVPIPGTKVLMCIHETRKKDYAAYAAANTNVDTSWRSTTNYGPSDGKDENCPAWRMTWDYAHAFCRWLSVTEGITYRLPSDHEWSCAVGIGEREQPESTPENLNGKVPNEYSWGSQWPPPSAAGNFNDITRRELFPTDKTIEGYTDGFPHTAPVMSFAPNKLGIYDLDGNLYEWCEDWFNEAQKLRVMRGGSFLSANREHFILSHRRSYAQDGRYYDFGFRCVVELLKP